MALRHEPVVADGRPARRPPSVERVPRRNGATASPTGARTARRRHRPERPRARACCWHVLRGDKKGMEVNRFRAASPGHDAQAEHVRVLPQGPLSPPAPRGSRVGARGARAEQNGAPRAAQAVPGGEALSTKMGDAHAEHAPEGLASSAVAWGTLGAHVVNARGARGACGGGGVSVRSLCYTKLRSV